MKTIFAVNGVIELLAGLAILFFAHAVPDFSNYGPDGFFWADMYAAAALTIAFLSFQAYKNFSEPAIKEVFLSTMIFFHIIVSVISYTGFQEQVLDMPIVTVLHGLMAAVFVFFKYFR